MTKKERILKALEEADLGPFGESYVGDMASALDGDRVDRMCYLLRVARAAGRHDERRARVQRRASRRRDPDQLGTDTQRMVVSGLGKRAAMDLDALTALQALFDSERDVLAMAVAGLRSQYSDTEIGIALGLQPDYARQGVGRRFGRRSAQDDLDSDSPVAEGPTT